MKTAQKTLSSLSLAAMLSAAALAQQKEAEKPADKPGDAPQAAAPAAAQPAVTAAAAAKPADAAQANEKDKAPAAGGNAAAPAAPGANGEQGLRLNFRGVSLDMVLDYLSEAAGFTIVKKVDVRGKVDVWSNQPLTKEEAVDLLDTVLSQNGYAAVRSGRTLKIVSREDAKKQNIAVKSGSDPDAIPATDEVVTQIIPVRYANATQLTKDLQPLLASGAELTANESANALVLTDTQADIRRMTEIVKALDTSISSITSVKVFPLKYADAKELASAVKELFQQPTQQNNNNNPAARFFARFGGGGGGGGPFGGGPFGGGNNQGQGTGTSEARQAASRVVAVADERSNSLVVGAPDEYMPAIEQLVKELDVSVSDVTELRVFHLRNSDPVEMADLFTQLFPDETKSGNDANPFQGGFRFNRGGFGGPGGNANRGNQSTESDRAKKKSRVVAVADQRTSSIIVSAASEMMPQVAEMIAQLDSSPAKKQKVFVYSLENADPQEAEQILQGLFQRSNTQLMNRNNANQNSALSTRQQSNNQNNNNNNTGFGNNGGGGGNSLGRGGTFR